MRDVNNECKDDFDGSYIENAILHIPSSSYQAYKETEPWSKFGTIVADGTPVSIFTTAGTQAGSAVSQNGRAGINTNLTSGSIAIIKIGTQSFKVAIK